MLHLLIELERPYPESITYNNNYMAAWGFGNRQVMFVIYSNSWEIDIIELPHVNLVSTLTLTDGERVLDILQGHLDEYAERHSAT